MSAYVVVRTYGPIAEPRAVAAGLLIIVPALALVSALLTLRETTPARPVAGGGATTAATTTLADAPAGLQAAAARAFEAEAYRPHPGPVAASPYRATNAAHGFDVGFAPSGVTVVPTRGDGVGGSWTISLRGYRVQGSAAEPMAAVSPVLEGERVEYRRSALTEWYRNDPEGLEQGFTLHRPPAGGAGGDIVLTMRTSGLDARAAGDGIELLTRSGAPVLTYDKLYVVDASGRVLPSRMRLDGGSIELIVGTSGARYPIVVDPLVTSEQQKLSITDAPGEDRFGSSVAIDGDWAVIGAPLTDVGGQVDAGAAYVFVRRPALFGGGWLMWQKLIAQDAFTTDWFGHAVTIDGARIVVGAPNGSSSFGGVGAKAYVFDRSGLTASYTQTQRLFTGGGDRLGESVALDGDTVIVGAPRGFVTLPTRTGAAHVYVESGGTWSQQQKITASDAEADADFGHSVSLDGDRAVIGAPLDDAGGADVGAAYVYTRSDGTWGKEVKLSATATSGSSGGEFGTAVALHGTTILAGAPEAFVFGSTRSGMVFAYTLGGIGWTEQDRLRPGDTTFSDFGDEIALDGDVALIGTQDVFSSSPIDHAPVYAFERSAGDWTEQARITPSDPQTHTLFGFAIALDGTQALVGAPGHDSDAGTNGGIVYQLFDDGTGWAEDAVIVPADAEGGNRFGIEVDIDFNRAVVAAYTTNTTAGRRAGVAYVFNRSSNTWHLEARLVAGDAFAGQEFGRDVAIGAGTVVVGALQAEAGDEGSSTTTRRGAAYVFSRNASGVWVQVTKLVADDGAGDDNFGARVEARGSTAIVAAPRNDNENGVNAGAVYVFELQFSGPFDPTGTWVQTQKLLAGDGGVDDELGWALDFDGTTLVAGAYQDDDNGDLSGSVYVFRRAGGLFAQQQKLAPSDGAAGDRFSFLRSLAVDGNTVLVGSQFADVGVASNAGAAYVFAYDGTTWGQEAKLTPSDGTASGFFGAAVALEGDVAVILAADTDSGDGRVAYVFTNWALGWTQHSTFTASDATEHSGFGSGGMVLDDGSLIVGSPSLDTTGGGFSTTEPGSAYVFTLDFTNTDPTVSDVADQTIDEDTSTGALSVTVGDVETPASELTVTGTSSNTAVVPNSGITLGGSGADRTVTVTPAPDANGTATITLTVSDGDGGSASDTFDVTVTAVNDDPTISDVADQTIAEDTSTSALQFTVGDVETAASDLTVTGTSSDTALIPNANITIGGSGADRTVTVTPAPDANGTATITLTVSDGDGGTASETFDVTVTPVNDLPTISDVADQTIDEDTSTGALAFTVGDVETPAGNLTVTGTSSDTAVVPNSGISFGGSGADRTVTVTPAADAFGTATITVTVDDGDGGSASDTFTVTVNPVNDAPVLVLSSTAESVQYSDPLTAVTATLTDVDDTPSQLSLTASGLPDDVALGATSMPDGDVTGGRLQATISGTVTEAPAVFAASVTGSDGSLSDTEVLTITVEAEDAAVTYTGPNLVFTPRANTGQVTITLMATVVDADDGSAGDVSNASVTFVDRDNANAVLCADPAVALVDPNDPSTGTAACDWDADIGAQETDVFTIGVIVGSYYHRDDSDDDAAVTVSRPVDTLVAGGGAIDVESSAGAYAAEAGTKMRFGFAMTYNKPKTKIVGRANVMYTTGDASLRIKSTAIDSLTGDIDNGLATFHSKAELIDVSDPDNPIVIDGNLSLRIDAIDNEDGTDELAVSLFRRNQLLFSSHWDGVTTQPRPLASGQLVVR